MAATPPVLTEQLLMSPVAPVLGGCSPRLQNCVAGVLGQLYVSDLYHLYAWNEHVCLSQMGIFGANTCQMSHPTIQ